MAFCASAPHSIAIIHVDSLFIRPCSLSVPFAFLNPNERCLRKERSRIALGVKRFWFHRSVCVPVADPSCPKVRLDNIRTSRRIGYSVIHFVDNFSALGRTQYLNGIKRVGQGECPLISGRPPSFFCYFAHCCRRCSCCSLCPFPLRVRVNELTKMCRHGWEEHYVLCPTAVIPLL